MHTHTQTNKQTNKEKKWHRKNILQIYYYYLLCISKRRFTQRLLYMLCRVSAVALKKN